MQPKYKVDEKVLCYHGPLLYEAKCTRFKKEGSSYSYLIHYQGWNKNWDEWVNDTRILKQSAENVEKQKKLLNSHMIAQAKGGKKTTRKDGVVAAGGRKSTKGGSDSNSNSRASTPVGDRVAPSRQNKRPLVEDDRSTSSRDDETKEQVSLAPKKKKRKIEMPVFLEDGAANLNIDIPQELKYILCRDWDNIVNKKRLFRIPAKVTVTNIIDQYISHINTATTSSSSSTATSSGGSTDNTLKTSLAVEVIRGFGDYFNVSLGSQLLYSFERYQYKQDCENAGAVQPCDVYGSQHLLRLILKIGDYLSASKFPESHVKMIEDQLEDFLLYLNTNRSMFFMKRSYYNAAQEYIQKNGKLMATALST
jgi:mortality factor 4-like protein 1